MQIWSSSFYISAHLYIIMMPLCNKQQTFYGTLDISSHIINNNNNTHNSGMRVESYGTGTQVRLPGKSAMEPRNFKFGTPYADMYKSLSETSEDVAYFMHNGVLQLCQRGASVKVG